MDSEKKENPSLFGKPGSRPQMLSAASSIEKKDKNQPRAFNCPLSTVNCSSTRSCARTDSALRS
ncbi:MAG: hypothetical protein ACPH5V_07760, partial [Alcanivorax sp.]